MIVVDTWVMLPSVAVVDTGMSIDDGSSRRLAPACGLHLPSAASLYCLRSARTARSSIPHSVICCSLSQPLADCRLTSSAAVIFANSLMQFDLCCTLYPEDVLFLPVGQSMEGKAQGDNDIVSRGTVPTSQFLPERI